MFIYDNQSEFFRFPQGGIKTGEEIVLKIYVKRNFMQPEVIIEKRRDYNKETFKKVRMEWIGTEKNYDLYQALFFINELGNYYYSFNFDKSDPSKLFELLIYGENYSTPDWIKGGTIYHIFVDRFYKTKLLTKNDDILLRNDWEGTPVFLPDEKGEIKNNDFFGGNIEGIKKKLPYISSLGVTALYLSPIFEAHSNHKYDTGDYFSVDPMFGTESSLKELLSEAETYGISVILDGVFSHTGSDSIYFNKKGRYNSLGAYQSKDSPYYNWYTFNNWNEDYQSWWNIKILPNLNKEDKNYVDFITGENGMLRYWQKLRIKGWRLDVADELPDSFLNILRSTVKDEDRDALIVGEVWEDASNKFSYGRLKQYFNGHQLDSVTNYPIRNAIISYVKDDDCTELYETMNYITEKYPPQSINCLMNILGTHDTERILTVLGCRVVPSDKEEMAKMKLSEDELKEGIKLLKIAVLLQMTLPGVPCIYYGDEAGMEGWKDPFNRRCFPWGNENKEILEHYKYLAVLRKTNNVFKEGKYNCIIHDKGVFAFQRYDEETIITIAVNMSPQTISLNFRENMSEYGNLNNDSKFNLKSNEYCILKKFN